VFSGRAWWCALVSVFLFVMPTLFPTYPRKAATSGISLQHSSGIFSSIARHQHLWIIGPLFGLSEDRRNTRTPRQGWGTMSRAIHTDIRGRGDTHGMGSRDSPVVTLATSDRRRYAAAGSEPIARTTLAHGEKEEEVIYWLVTVTKTKTGRRHKSVDNAEGGRACASGNQRHIKSTYIGIPAHLI
jgi:hypothetical protein